MSQQQLWNVGSMSTPSTLFSELTKHGFVQSLTWEEVRPDDKISFVYFGRWGFERAHRTVVAVDWPTISLLDEDREYDIDVVKERQSKGASRDIRLERPRVPNSHPESCV